MIGLIKLRLTCVEGDEFHPLVEDGGLDGKVENRAAGHDGARC